MARTEQTAQPAAAPAPPPAAPAAPVAPAAESPSELDRQIGVFAQKWFDLNLDPDKCRQVAALLGASSAPAPRAPDPGPAAQAKAASVVESGRERIQKVIQQGLERTQDTVRSATRSEREAEANILGAVERATSLEDLRPPKPRVGDESAQPPLAQFAHQLQRLIRVEVDACFQQQFAPLAQQLQSVIEAARSKGLLAENTESGLSEPSRSGPENKSGGDSAKTAPNTDPNNDKNNAGKAP